jgi:hypothetical protein
LADKTLFVPEKANRTQRLAEEIPHSAEQGNVFPGAGNFFGGNTTKAGKSSAVA